MTHDLSSLSHTLRKRFIKDCGIPLSVVQDPHFAYMLDLYDPFYGSRAKLDLLLAELLDCGSEDGFFARSNALNDRVIEAVQATPAYRSLEADALKQFDLGPSRFATETLYHPANDGRVILSVDLVKANFQAMRYVDPALVLGAASYVELLGQFTDREYHLQSKQIRQVIFGNLLPKKQQKIQKWIMRQLMEKASELRLGSGVRDVSSDEFAILTDDVGTFEGFVVLTTDERLERDLADLREAMAATPFETRVTPYRLHQIPQTGYYVKVKFDGSLPEPKCVPSHYMPQVLKHLRGLPITEDDLVFHFEGAVAAFRNPVLRHYRQFGREWRQAA